MNNEEWQNELNKLQGRVAKLEASNQLQKEMLVGLAKGIIEVVDQAADARVGGKYIKSIAQQIYSKLNH